MKIHRLTVKVFDQYPSGDTVESVEIALVKSGYKEFSVRRSIDLLKNTIWATITVPIEETEAHVSWNLHDCHNIKGQFSVGKCILDKPFGKNIKKNRERQQAVEDEIDEHQKHINEMW